MSLLYKHFHRNVIYFRFVLQYSSSLRNVSSLRFVFAPLHDKDERWCKHKHKTLSSPLTPTYHHMHIASSCWIRFYFYAYARTSEQRFIVQKRKPLLSQIIFLNLKKILIYIEGLKFEVVALHFIFLLTKIKLQVKLQLLFSKS